MKVDNELINRLVSDGTTLNNHRLAHYNWEELRAICEFMRSESGFMCGKNTTTENDFVYLQMQEDIVNENFRRRNQTIRYKNGEIVHSATL